MKLDRIPLEQRIHESVNSNELKKLLLQSDIQACNFMGHGVDGLLKKWDALAQVVT